MDGVLLIFFGTQKYGSLRNVARCSPVIARLECELLLGGVDPFRRLGLEASAAL